MEIVIFTNKSYILKLVIFLLITLVTAQAGGCSSCRSDKNLGESVQKFWLAQQEGKWHICYSFFSDEMLIRLRAKNPALFADESTYATGRAKYAQKRSISTFNIISTDLASDSRSATVEIGVRYKGQQLRTLVSQRWALAPGGKQWQLVDNLTPAP